MRRELASVGCLRRTYLLLVTRFQFRAPENVEGFGEVNCAEAIYSSGAQGYGM